MRPNLTLLAACAFGLAITAALACSGGASANQQRGSGAGPVKSESVESEREKLLISIRAAALDVGERGDQVRRELRRHGREHLIRTVTELRDSLPEDDPQRVVIALLFCSVDHEYNANRQLIVSEFGDDPPYQSLPDDAWAMIGRLIRWGDKDLLSLGFTAAERADGALASGLIDTFVEQLNTDPERFLKELAKQPGGVRKHVYDLLTPDKFVQADLAKLRKYLQSVPPRSALSPVARELSNALALNGKGDRDEGK